VPFVGDHGGQAHAASVGVRGPVARDEGGGVSETHQPPSANHSEGVLVAAALAGSDQAFARVVERYRAQLQLHCYRMLGSLQDAEHVVQETFLRAWRRLSTFQGRSTFRSWRRPSTGPATRPGRPGAAEAAGGTDHAPPAALAGRGRRPGGVPGSDHARSITATGVNITNGGVAD
jgi:hypothetical protein